MLVQVKKDIRHDRLGCPDSDGDGYSDGDGSWTSSDGADVFPNDPTQWQDSDFDGYGDNQVGNNIDSCPSEWGDSWRNNTLGCPDADQDGWADMMTLNQMSHTMGGYRW